jgi:uncharacterized repeat protein (TIGR01451 family)
VKRDNLDPAETGEEPFAASSSPDLKVEKRDNVDSVAAGETIQYTVEINNFGGTAATGLVLTDTVPANTTFNGVASTSGWNCADGDPAGTECIFDLSFLGPITPFSTIVLSFAVDVDRPIAADATEIVNVIEVGDDGASGPDANQNDNTDTEQTTVNAAPDLQVSKDDGVDFAPSGGTILYTIVYTNTGDRDSDSTIISETVPAHTTWDPTNSSAGWACNPAGGPAGTNCTIHVGTVSGAGGGGSVIFAATVDNPLPGGVTETTNNVDIYGISSVPDQNPEDNSFSLVTELKSPPQITGVSPAVQTVQYSDMIATVTISATDPGPDVLTLSTSWSKDGGATEGTPLPENLSLSVASCSTPAGGGQECAWTLSGQVLEAARTYVIVVTASDGVLTSEPMTITITVEPEDAVVAFADSNPVSVLVASDGGDSGPFTLDIDITEFDDPNDVTGDLNLAGDISLAGVTMSLVSVGPGGSENPQSCTTTTTPGLSDPDSPYNYDLLTVSCDFDTVPVNTYVVQVNVGGDYYAASGEEVLTVYDPSLGFTTGGGWFYWPGTEDKTNFGYTMKYNRKGTKVQGSLLAIRHLPDGSIYRLKSNAINGLALGDIGGIGWASFTGKATYLGQGMFEPQGNHTFIVYVEDHNQPSAGSDRFWVEVQDKDGAVVSDMSLDPPAAGNAETIQGGNIVVPQQSGKKGPS